MSDEELRRLARDRARGVSADEAGWLVARLRAGELSVERLRLAAYLGSPAARQVLGADAPPSPLGPLAIDLDRPAGARPSPPPAGLADEGAELGPLLRAVVVLGHQGRELCARTTVAIADALASVQGLAGGEEVVLGLVRAWLVCPCDEHAAALAGAMDRGVAGTHQGGAALLAVGAVLEESPETCPRDALTHARRRVSARVLHEVVRGDLAAWALGLRDAARGPALRAAPATLHAAATTGDVERARALATKATLDATDRDGKTPLALAIEAARVEVVRALLELGADPDAPTRDGKTPLHVACDGPSLLEAERLQLLDASLDEPQALARATDAALAIVRLLLAAGAEVDPLHERHTPLDLARMGGLERIAGVLLKAGADPAAGDAVRWGRRRRSR